MPEASGGIFGSFVKSSEKVLSIKANSENFPTSAIKILSLHFIKSKQKIKKKPKLIYTFNYI
jgi:hypothetical protein